MDFGDYRCSVCGEMLIEQAKQCPNCPTEAEERMLPLINQIADLRSSNARLREALERAEWCMECGLESYCPACGNWKPGSDCDDVGHNPDCWLAKALEADKCAG